MIFDGLKRDNSDKVMQDSLHAQSVDGAGSRISGCWPEEGVGLKGLRTKP